MGRGHEGEGGEHRPKGQGTTSHPHISPCFIDATTTRPVSFAAFGDVTERPKVLPC